MKPICVKCQRFYRMKKSGFYFTEQMPKGNLVVPGTAQPEGWVPYKIWSGDLWQCEGCKHELVSGTGLHPIAEHYQSDFSDVSERLGAWQFKVNDS